MTKHMFIIPLMALSIAGAADTACAMNGRTAAANQESRSSLPNLNIEAACQDVAKNDLNKTTDYPGCMSKERASREQLQKEWASYPADMHEQCVHSRNSSSASKLCDATGMSQNGARCPENDEE